MKGFYAVVLILMTSLCSVGQVSEIKSASSVHNSRSGSSAGSDGYGGGNFVGDLVFNIFFGGVIDAQQQRLQRRHQIPGLISLDLMLHTGIQPSSYYIVHPRLRANWGLFSTDFRLNYIIEEGLDGVEILRTNEWQILQANLVTTPEVTWRIGGGFLQEAFNDRQVFAEWSTAFHYQPQARKLGCFAEYRAAEPRREVSGTAQYRIFDQNSVHGFLSAGIIYQRYYQLVTTWGLQGGFILRVY
jgi:hypothetical protein